MRFDRGITRCRLRKREGTEGDRLVEVPPRQSCRFLIGDELVVPRRISHPPLNDGDTVLFEEQPVCTSDRLRRTREEGI